MLIEILSFATLFSALLAIWSNVTQKIRLFAILKPLTTILILTIAGVNWLENHNNYTFFLITGLIFALVGDIFLLQPKNFLYGLSAFLVAHIFFTLAFSSVFGFQYTALPILILIGLAGFYYNFLRKNLQNFALPVLVYICMIVIMNWQAISVVMVSQKLHFIALAMASVFFTISDAIIAYKKFKNDFKIAEIVILSTYWLAIFVFARVGGFL